MEDSPAVEVGQSVEDLVQEGLDRRFFEFAVFPQTATHRTTGHVLEKDAQERVGLFETEVLDDVGVIEILERLDLGLERVHDTLLTTVFAIAFGGWQLDLLDGNHLTSGCVQREVDPSISALADEVTLHPFEDGCEDRKEDACQPLSQSLLTHKASISLTFRAGLTRR